MPGSLRHTNPRQRQNGAATLLMTMSLLLGMSLTLLYLNRSLVIEQKSAANQVRAALALEMAEAGLEWATGMLNTAQRIDSTCALSSGASVSFRRQYLQTNWGKETSGATEMAPASTSYPGCKIDGNSWICTCPDPSGSIPTTSSPGSAQLPGFTVSFLAASDPEAVRIIATGCSAQTGACTPSNSLASDANATVSAILKLRRLPRALPAAALTCGSSCTVGGSYTLFNQDLGSGGLLIDAGGAINLSNEAALVSIPGQPGATAILHHDSALSTLSSSDTDCSQSTVFASFFGSTLAQYARAPMTKTIADCGAASNCDALVDASYAEGWRSFYFPDGFARSKTSVNLGSATDPVTLVSNAGFNLNGNSTIYGLLFNNDSTVTDWGSGSVQVRGAWVACAGHSSNGSGALTYDASILQTLQRSTAPLVRVPGSWTDRCRAGKEVPPIISCS